MSRYLSAVAVLLAGVLATSGCGTAEEKPDEPAFLLVQSSRGFQYDGERLVVHGTSPSTIFFSDRPERIAGHLPLETAFAWGRSGDDNFVDDPPNATLSILEEGEMANVVLTLSGAVIEGDTISFDVDILEGELPERGGANSLFIDVLGRPLTPLSVAGVHRRTRRRSLAVGVAVGAAAAGSSSHGDAQSTAAATSAAASADQAADAADRAADAAEDAADATASTGASSLEQDLARLKDLLDKGLITQQDYDAKKKELLDGL
jgi:hypothetical protein